MDVMYMTMAMESMMSRLLTSTGSTSLLDGVLDTINLVISWLGAIIDSFISADGALKALWPFVLVGLVVSVLLLAIKIIRNFSWGI